VHPAATAELPLSAEEPMEVRTPSPPNLKIAAP